MACCTTVCSHCHNLVTVTRDNFAQLAENDPVEVWCADEADAASETGAWLAARAARVSLGPPGVVVAYADRHGWSEDDQDFLDLAELDRGLLRRPVARRRRGGAAAPDDALGTYDGIAQRLHGACNDPGHPVLVSALPRLLQLKPNEVESLTRPPTQAGRAVLVRRPHQHTAPPAVTSLVYWPLPSPYALYI